MHHTIPSGIPAVTPPLTPQACHAAFLACAPFLGLQDLLADMDVALCTEASGAQHTLLLGKVCQQLVSQCGGGTSLGRCQAACRRVQSAGSQGPPTHPAGECPIPTNHHPL